MEDEPSSNGSFFISLDKEEDVVVVVFERRSEVGVGVKARVAE